MVESAGYPNVVAGRSAADNTPTDILMDPTSYALYTGVWVWNSSSLIWEKMTQPKTSDTANNYVWNGAAWVEEEQAKTTDNVEIYGYNGTNWQTIKIDSSTRAINTIDYAHHEVHGGSSYWAAVNATLGNGEIATIGFTTPDTTKWAHLLLQIDVNASCLFEVLEDVTSFSGGAAFTVRNFNRNSANASGMTVITGYTGSNLITPTGGTTIWSENLGTKGVSTSRSNASELVMKQNSNYLFRVTNGATSNPMTILLTWYEHTDNAA